MVHGVLNPFISGPGYGRNFINPVKQFIQLQLTERIDKFEPNLVRINISFSRCTNVRMHISVTSSAGQILNVCNLGAKRMYVCMFTGCFSVTVSMEKDPFNWTQGRDHASKHGL